MRPLLSSDRAHVHEASAPHAPTPSAPRVALHGSSRIITPSLALLRSALTLVRASNPDRARARRLILEW
jgi:hypothetical protein